VSVITQAEEQAKRKQQEEKEKLLRENAELQREHKDLKAAAEKAAAEAKAAQAAGKELQERLNQCEASLSAVRNPEKKAQIVNGAGPAQAATAGASKPDKPSRQSFTQRLGLFN
jgi:DNA repair exonuclease SbcCD ATPase subunit